MTTNGTGQQSPSVEVPDNLGTPSTHMNGSEEPVSAMLARAMLSAQDAERRLEQARELKAEAERYRAQVQHETVELTEAQCAEMREDAEQDLELARRLRDEAETKWELARLELERASVTREDADAYMAAVRTEADEYRRSVMAETRHQAEATKRKSIEQAAEDARRTRQEADEEVRRAITGIETMQAAVQAELEAQQTFTEALRIRALAPKVRETPELSLIDPAKTELGSSRPKATRRPGRPKR